MAQPKLPLNLSKSVQIQPLVRSRTAELDFECKPTDTHNKALSYPNINTKNKKSKNGTVAHDRIYNANTNTLPTLTKKKTKKKATKIAKKDSEKQPKLRSCARMKLQSCQSIQNISYILGLYHEWMRSRKAILNRNNEGMYDRIHNKNSKIRNRTQLLNDFNHILDNHAKSNRELETVQKYIQNTALCGKCVLKKGQYSCTIITRHLRDTRKEQNNHSIKARKFYGYDSAKEIVTQQLLDTIHSFVYHSFDTLRFTTAEQKEIDQLCNDENEEYFISAEAIKKAQKIIAKKKKMVALICKYDPYKANKKFYSDVCNGKDETEPQKFGHNRNNSSLAWDMNAMNVNMCTEYNTDTDTIMSVYSFGKQFIYHKSMRSESTFHLLIRPIYQNFKDELLNNKIYKVSKSNFNDTFEKALVAFSTDKAKKMHSKRCDKKQKIAEFVTVQHLLSIIFYTDYSNLSFRFSQTYRRKSDTEKWSDVVRRHSQYYHWGLLLKESVEYFGSIAKGSSAKLRKRNTFFHGLNQQLAFTTFIAQFYGPTSFTDELGIAQAFAKDEGMILSLQPHRKWPSLYFDCRWLSVHASENEKLVIGGQNPLNIYTIITVSYPQTNHRKYLVAMMHISQMIGVESQDIKLSFKDIHQRYVRLLIENELLLNAEIENKYMSESFHIFCANVENVMIDTNHILFEKMPTLFKDENGHLKEDMFRDLFPNARAIRVRLSAVKSKKICLNADSCSDDIDAVTADLMELVSVFDENISVTDMNTNEHLHQWYQNDNGSNMVICDRERKLQDLRDKYIDAHTGLGPPNAYCQNHKNCGWRHVDQSYFFDLSLAQKLHGYFYHNSEYSEYEAKVRSAKYCETHFKKEIRKSDIIPQTPVLQSRTSSIQYTGQLYDKPDCSYHSTMREMAPSEFSQLQFGDPWEMTSISDRKYKDPKEEILENLFERLDKTQWNDILRSSVQVSKKKEAKLIALSVKLIVALKLYTNCDKLQNQFILAYRHEDRQQRIRRQKAFWNWNNLLVTSCRRSQDIITDKLYRGVNQCVTTQSFTGRFWGPVSCTTDFAIANGFVGNDGTILEMYPTFNKRGLKVAWLSMFPYEKEVLYFSTSFQISNIYYKDKLSSHTLTDGYLVKIAQNSDFMERAILKALQIINIESSVIDFSDINDLSNDTFNTDQSGFNELDGSEKIAVLYLLYLQYRSDKWDTFWNKLPESIKFAFAKYRDQFISLAKNMTVVKMEKLSMLLQDFFCQTDQTKYEFPIIGNTAKDIEHCKRSVQRKFEPYQPLNFGTIVRLFPNAQQISINGNNFDWTLDTFVRFVDQYQLDYQNIAIQDIHIKFESQYPYDMDDITNNVSTPSLRSISAQNLFDTRTYEDVQASKLLNKYKDKSRKNIHKLKKLGWKFESPSHITRIGFEPLPELPFFMTFMSNNNGFSNDSNNRLFYRTYSQILLNKEAFLTMSNCVVSESMELQRSDMSDEFELRHSRITTPNSGTTYDEGNGAFPDTFSGDDIDEGYDIDQIHFIDMDSSKSNSSKQPGSLPSMGTSLYSSYNSSTRASTFYPLKPTNLLFNQSTDEQKCMHSSKRSTQTEGSMRNIQLERDDSIVIDYNPINCTLSSQVLSTLNYKNELIQQLKWKKKHSKIKKINDRLKQSFNKYCNMVKSLVLDPMPAELQSIFLKDINKKVPCFQSILTLFPNVVDVFLRETQLKLKIFYEMKSFLENNRDNCKLERIFFCKQEKKRLSTKHTNSVKSRLNKLDWDLNEIEQMIFCQKPFSLT